MSYYSIGKLYKGQTVYVLCGGTSVTQDTLSLLQGLPVVAVNQMYEAAPWSQVMFFGDAKWGNREVTENRAAFYKYGGLKLTTAREIFKGKGIKYLRRLDAPAGLATSPDSVAMSRTSAQAAMNVAYHLGATRIVLVGVDNAPAATGKVHCHAEYPKRWPRYASGWADKQAALKTIVKPLADAGIVVLNASPISTLPWWPIVNLEDVI